MTELEVLMAKINGSYIKHPKNPGVKYYICSLLKIHTDGGWVDGVEYAESGTFPANCYARPLSDFGKFYLA